MFDEIDGLPVHALIVHATVVFVPLAALLGILFVIPRTSRWARLPFLLLSLAIVPLTWVTKESGEELKASRGFTGELLDAIETHQERGDQLFVVVIVNAAIAVFAYAVAQSPKAPKALYQAACVLVVIGAVAMSYQVYRTGDSGARAVWGADAVPPQAALAQ